MVHVNRPPRKHVAARKEESEEYTHTYRVVGPHPVYGVKPGCTGQMTMTEDRERYLVDVVGAIVRLPDYIERHPETFKASRPNLSKTRKNRPE